MLIIPGQPGKDLCDRHLQISRRDLLRVGGAGMLGLSLGAMFRLQAQAKDGAPAGGPGWGKAKSIILCYLQGGPSHIDLWDPKENVPDNVRSAFQPISTEDPGHHAVRNTAQAGPGERPVYHDSLDELHAQRAVQSYGRHLPDDDRLHDRQGQPVGPVGTPLAQGLPELRIAVGAHGSDHRTDVALRHAPPPAARERRGRQRRHRRLPGQGLRPVHALPGGRRPEHEQDGQHQDRRPAIAAPGVCRPAEAAGQTAGHPGSRDAGHRQGRGRLPAGRVLRPGAELDRVGPSPRRVRLGTRTRRGPRPVRPQHVRPELPAGPALGRSRHPRGRSHLAQGGQFRQPLVGPPHRPDQADGEAVRLPCSTAACPP